MRICLKDDMSELLNVVGEEGDFLTDETGKLLTVPRGIAHTYGILHCTTNVLLVSPHSAGDDIRVYLQKRSCKKRLFPRAWTVSCGGHMGISIDPVKSAVREAKEELGLQIDPSRLAAIHSNDIRLRNTLKVWRFGGKPYAQFGSLTECIGKGCPEKAVLGFIEGTPLDEFPGPGAPRALELEAFNREFCFYYAYCPSEEELEQAMDQKTDGEAAEVKGGKARKLKEVSLQEFLDTERPDRTDSSDLLITHRSELERAVRDALKSRTPS